MRIIIDGDGSPVKELTIEITKQYNIQVIIVTSIDHFSTKEFPENVSLVYVDKGADAADYKIVQLIQKGDLLITQDYGLASLVLPKGVRVFHHLSFEYTAGTIDQLLEQRYFSAKIRKSGGHTKGPKAFTKENREEFKKKLLSFLEEEGYSV